MARYAVGDLQGCFQPFLALLSAIDFHPDRDQLWLCGDLVNRGPESLEVLRWVFAHRDQVRCVLGNHDLHLLAVASGHSAQRKNDSFDSILNAPDREQLLNYLQGQPLLQFDEDWLMVHAGIPPGWNFAQLERECRRAQAHWQAVGDTFFAEMYGNEPALWREDLSGADRTRYTINALTRMRYVYRDGALELKQKCAPGQQAPELQPWFTHPNVQTGGRRVVFGHWASLMGQCTHPQVFALDTGCVWGNRLTALRLEDCERFSVCGWQRQC